MASSNPIIKVTFAGATSVVLRDSDVHPVSCAVDSDGSIWTIDKLTAGTYWGVYRVSAPGGGADVRTLYYLFSSGITTFYNGTQETAYWQNMRIYGNNLYFIYGYSTYNANYQLIKFADITGTAAMSIIDTGIAIATYKIHDILIESDTEIYITLSDGAIGTSRYVKLFAYSGTAWALSTIVDTHEYVSVYHYTAYGDIRPLQKNNYDEYILGGVVESSTGIIRVYDSSWVQLESIELSGVTNAVGFGIYIGDESDEKTYTVCGYTSDNVYKIFPRTFVLGDTEPSMKNTIAHIVSNVNDLGMSQDKRISRAYLDMDCKYPGCGSFSLEPSYEVNYYTHAASGETSQPDGSVSMRPWQHPGHKTWVYTNSAFDSDVEQWLPLRLDVGTKGNKFRYAIRAGDVATNVTGQMLIKPPRLEVQVLGKGGKDD